MRKQFPVDWLTSKRLTSTIQCVKARRRQQTKKMAALAEGFLHVLDLVKLSHFNDENTTETGLLDKARVKATA